MKILKRIMLYFFLLIIVVILFLSSLLYFDFFGTQFKDIEEAILYQSKNIKSPENQIDTLKELKVLSWNIKFGGGRVDFFFECYGDRAIMNFDEVSTNIENISKKINDINPDIVFLQEVDRFSKRSAFIDQIQTILDKTDLNYGYYASQWRSSYIPSHGLGKIDSGNLILSRYPLKNGKRYSLPLIKNHSFLTKYFYLKRNILEVELDFNSKKIYLINTHTSAFATDDTKQKQILILKKHLDKINERGEIFIAGGDLNTIPPYSKQIENFEDSFCMKTNSYKKDIDLNLLNPFYKDFKGDINLEEYQNSNQKTYFTHTANKNGFWNRKLDYIFTNGDILDSKTFQDTIELSDHAPILIKFNIH